MTPEEQIAEQTKQIETLTTQLADASKGADEGLRTQLADLEKLNKELIEGRDKAKTDKRAAEDKILAEQGEFKTLSEKLTAEKADLEKQLEGLNGSLGKYKERDEARLKTLLELVPDDFKEIVGDETLPLSTRLSLAEKHAVTKNSGPGSRNAGQGSKDSLTRAEFEALSPAERSKHCTTGGTITD